MTDELEGEALANGVLSSQGVNFIGGWEGFRAHLYNDALGHCTIGYGHLVHRGACTGAEPPRFKSGLTRAQALKLLKADAAVAVGGVNRGVHVTLNQTQFDALVSFTFNVGVGAFLGSTLLRMLNEGRYSRVPGELMRWTNNGLPGLVRRRKAESTLFSGGVYRANSVQSDDAMPAPPLEPDSDPQPEGGQ